MLTRRALLAMAPAALGGRVSQIDTYGEIIYHSPNPSAQVFIIGHLHETDTALDSETWSYVVESQRETYGLLEIARRSGARNLLLEGFERGISLDNVKYEPCMPDRGCVDATLQYVARHREMKASGWDDTALNQFVRTVHALWDPDQRQQQLAAVRSTYPSLGTVTTLDWRVTMDAYQYALRKRSADLLIESMRKNPSVATTGMLHLDHLVPWIVNRRIVVDGADGSQFGISMPPFEYTFDPTYYEFTLIKTNARIENGIKSQRS